MEKASLLLNSKDYHKVQLQHMVLVTGTRRLKTIITFFRIAVCMTHYGKVFFDMNPKSLCNLLLFGILFGSSDLDMNANKTIMKEIIFIVNTKRVEL